MLTIYYTTQFKKDFKRVKKQHKDLPKMQAIVEHLVDDLVDPEAHSVTYLAAAMAQVQDVRTHIDKDMQTFAAAKAAELRKAQEAEAAKAEDSKEPRHKEVFDAKSDVVDELSKGGSVGMDADGSRVELKEVTGDDDDNVFDGDVKVVDDPDDVTGGPDA